MYPADPTFNGAIDEFRIYHHNLNIEQIKRLASRDCGFDELAEMSEFWLSVSCLGEDFCLSSDYNGDYAIDLADYAALADNWLFYNLE
jgi:hypothetical protein